MEIAGNRATLTATSTIGIVNRGEPALRFVRAAREFNLTSGTALKTVAFHLDEEADALFVREADAALPFHAVPGAPRGASAYLDPHVLVEALKQAGCDGVWAGWGFVSEDASFVAAVEAADMVFLGPDSRVMGQLGDKIEAKSLAEKSGVPILPWSLGPVRDVDSALLVAQEIGYPLIIKAAHAGGGRGIRAVRVADELEDRFHSARDETVRVTGDDVMFIERLVTKGRHLEVQCLCDRHGTVLTFGVRDCSVQRRNQKILEETPPAGLPADRLAEIERAAESLMRTAGYESAGTVEFLYDLEREDFSFMEVNTRLQVEHPITEELYGIDLVKGQIQVALGEELPTTVPAPRGWVIEARLNAEDPDRDFAPSPGTVRRFRVPLGPGVRVDSGVGQGSVIPAIFDSMVAKVIASGRTREEALGRLERALRETRMVIDGGTTNKAFLLELLSRPAIRSGAVHTGFVEEMLSGGNRLTGPDPAVALIAAAVDSYERHEGRELAAFRQQISNSGHPRSGASSGLHEVSFGLQGASYRFTVRRSGPTQYVVVFDESETITVSFVHNDDESRLELAGRRYSIQTTDRSGVLQCEVDGVPYALQAESGGAVRSPSPAVVLVTHVGPGDTVEKGQRLVSLEAMKMEMIVEAPTSGVVSEVPVKPGQQVTAGDVLVGLEPGEPGDAPDAAGRGASAGEPRPAFPAEADDVGVEWDRRVTALSALFFGYDHPANVDEVFRGLVEMAPERGMSRELFDVMCRLLEAHVRIDGLFSAERIDAEQFARPVTWRELTFIYFQYSMEGSKTLPSQFVDALASALRYYPSGTAESGSWSAFYHMYRAQQAGSMKSRLIRSMLFALEGLSVPDGESRRLLRLLDDVIELSRRSGQPHSDAALHARYELYDRVSALTSRRLRRSRFREELATYLAIETDDATRRRAAETIVDSSAYAEYELLCAYRVADVRERAAIAELAARRARRDTVGVEAALVHRNGHPAAVARFGGAATLVVLCADSEEARPHLIEEMLDHLDTEPSATDAVLIVAAAGDPEPVFRAFAEQALAVRRISIGIYRDSRDFSYRTYGRDGEQWGEDRARREFSPLFYRELRLGRLSEFDTEVVYHSDSVYLVMAVARSNDRDQRLLAYGGASESAPELGEDGRITRVSEFDDVFTEAVYEMRSLQSRRDRRLVWNRIIMHVRALSPTTAVQIKEYGNRMIPSTSDLGLEKAIIYTRRKRWSESVIRELELLFLNISEDQFTLRSRSPSAEALRPMDRYVTNVVRSRQRGTVYPYELIRLITYTGYPVSVNVPRGEFVEYDIQTDADGNHRAVSVEGREYGWNASNIVFGVIRNQDPDAGRDFRRVLILSDATRDMGSLAEGECRRVIAALDLACELGVPVEWVPVSSGARIDMESGTENLDWTAAVLRRIVQFTQDGGEINVIVSGINVGAQSYWNAEATMLMHSSGLLIMTDDASMLLTGKKALDFSGSVSGDTNLDIGGAERIMAPNGQAQVRVKTLTEAYTTLFAHYRYTFREPGDRYPARVASSDRADRNVGEMPYEDRLGQGFSTIGDIFSARANPERKKPFDMRQIMGAVIDQDAGHLERWEAMKDGETAIVWETRLGGYGVGLIGTESRSLVRIGDIPHDGPETWSGGTLFPNSSKKVARAINAWSGRLAVVVLANLSGFDGSPESLRRLQLEFGAEIGRAVVNFAGPIVFVVVARYHGGAYVVFSRALNPSLTVYALEGSRASVLGGAPAAAVVFPRQVDAETRKDPRVTAAAARRADGSDYSRRDYDDVYQSVYAEKQTEMGIRFDRIHNIERAKSVGSIHDIITVEALRPTLIRAVERGMRTRHG